MVGSPPGNGQAKDDGIDDSMIEAIRSDAKPPLHDVASQAAYDGAWEMHESRQLSADTYQPASQALGPEDVADLIGILGYSKFIPMTFNAFEIETSDGSKPFANLA